MTERTDALDTLGDRGMDAESSARIDPNRQISRVRPMTDSHMSHSSPHNELLNPDANWTTWDSTSTARMRLLCFPYAGASSALFMPWCRILPPDIEVRGLQLPGRGSRFGQEPLMSFDEALQSVAASIGPLLDRPVALFGHSLGATFAFEISRWLRGHCGVQPEHLLVAGRRAPHLPDTDPLTMPMSDREFVAYIHGLGGTPPEVLDEPDLLEVVLPLLRADFSLVETYRYTDGALLSCPITVLGGREDEESDFGRLEAWGRHTTGATTVHRLPGDHFFLRSSEAELLAIIAGVLGRCPKASAPTRVEPV